MKLDWGQLLIGQLEFYRVAHLRPRLQGMTDDEYYWDLYRATHGTTLTS